MSGKTRTAEPSFEIFASLFWRSLRLFSCRTFSFFPPSLPRFKMLRATLPRSVNASLPRASRPLAAPSTRDVAVGLMQQTHNSHCGCGACQRCARRSLHAERRIDALHAETRLATSSLLPRRSRPAADRSRPAAREATRLRSIFRNKRSTLSRSVPALSRGAAHHCERAAAFCEPFRALADRIRCLSSPGFRCEFAIRRRSHQGGSDQTALYRQVLMLSFHSQEVGLDFKNQVISLVEWHLANRHSSALCVHRKLPRSVSGPMLP